MKSISKIALGITASSLLFSLALAENKESIIYQGDLLNHQIIHGSDTEDSTLYFGDSLEHFLKWDAQKNMFIFSDNVDFGGNQIINARFENLQEAPECTEDASGRVFFNLSNNFSYVCNGTLWKQIDEEAGNPAPYIKNITPSKLSVGSPTTITINGGNFVAGMTVSIPNFSGTVADIKITSPTTMSVSLNPAATDTGIYDIVMTNDGSSNTDWPGNGVGLLQVETILTPGNTSAPLWVRTSGVTTGIGEILPANNGNAWNKGGSFGTIPASTNFRLSFQPKYMAGHSSNGRAMIGVDVSDPDINYTSIDYAIYLDNGTLYVYENNSFKGSFGSYTVSDTLGIQRNGSTIEYYKNGNRFYTSSTQYSGSLVFDSSLYQYLGATNIKVIY